MRNRNRKGRKSQRKPRNDSSRAVTSVVGPVSRLASFNSPTYQFARSTAPVLLTKPVAADYAAQTSYQLADLPSYTEYTALFDAYIIDRVTVTFRLQAGTATGSTAPSSITLFVAPDYDGGPVPAMADLVQRKHTEVVLTLTHPTHSFSFKPRLASSVNALSGSALSGMPRTWVDMATPTALWYGASFVLWGYNNSYSGSVWLSEELLFRARGPR